MSVKVQTITKKTRAISPASSSQQKYSVFSVPSGFLYDQPFYL